MAGFAFHYVISDAVVYLAMTPKSYPKRAIFRYLYLDAPAAREAWSKRDRARHHLHNPSTTNAHAFALVI